MIPLEVLQAYLLSRPALTGHVGTRVYWPGLPGGWDKAKALVLSGQGRGGDIRYDRALAHRALHQPRTACVAWAQTAYEGHQIQAALREELHERNNLYVDLDGARYRILHAECNGDASELPADPDYHVIPVVSFYEWKVMPV